jgi:DNA adenine methylase
MLKAANISTIPQRSPFRYPGGKTWLIPQVRNWLNERGGERITLVEPFAGGGIVTLTAIMEKLVGSAIMVELDADVAAVWRTILGRNGLKLVEQVRNFEFTEDNVRSVLQTRPNSLVEQAFQTLLNNRVKRNGILAAGAGILKEGEAGYGLKSRWYPGTLTKRMLKIIEFKGKISLEHGDGLQYLNKFGMKRNFIYFIDPPYNCVGKRLYRHGQINDDNLFRILMRLQGDFLMTYNRTNEILKLAEKYGLQTQEIVMNGGLNHPKIELIISRDLCWI